MLVCGKNACSTVTHDNLVRRLQEYWVGNSRESGLENRTSIVRINEYLLQPAKCYKKEIKKDERNVLEWIGRNEKQQSPAMWCLEILENPLQLGHRLWERGYERAMNDRVPEIQMIQMTQGRDQI